MEVFVRGVPASASETEFEKFFSAPIKALGIVHFVAQKSKNKTFGSLTFSTTASAQRFLTAHGTSKSLGDNRTSAPTKPLKFHNRVVICTESRNPPNEFALRSLENRTQATSDSYLARNEPKPDTDAKEYRFLHLTCGFWAYQNFCCEFVPAYNDQRSGLVQIQPGRITIDLAPDVSIEIKHASIMSIYAYRTNEMNGTSSITFSLYYAPSFISTTDLTGKNETDPSLMMAMLGLRESKTVRRRVDSLRENHKPAAGHCFLYRLMLPTSTELGHLVVALKGKPSIPSVYFHKGYTTSLHDFGAELKSFLDLLRPRGAFGGLPFMVKFQCHKLASNGYLRPSIVAALLEFLRDQLQQTREYAVVDALRKVMRDLPCPGPETLVEELGIDKVKDMIVQYARQFVYSGSDFEHARRHKMSIGLVHRVYVTPVGIYPYAIMLETKNPILRKYSNKSDRFIRVTFADEDFERLDSNRDIDRSETFARFRKVMQDGLFIGGDYFQFLGFSHSSLRMSQCWFMSVFRDDKGLALNPIIIIKDLGDFSRIRSPARCAARIGQAFSDTTHAIKLQPGDIVPIPDIERNGRNFSDGIGTISESILEEVWRVFSRTRKDRATVLQIRFQGAKGVLALDSRLHGRQICLRDSMIKFKGSTDHSLGICGGAFRPLPMYLNRSYIKILEDLGVPAENFLDLQSSALKDLRGMRESPTDARNFLEKNHLGTAAQIPLLIGLLDEMELDFRRDKFLRDIVDLAATIQLRDLKYRSRIPVPDAHTLFGIVDETGLLLENQVYVPVRDRNGSRRVLIGEALVTRAPALHPGDIQKVYCVDVAASSPLESLHNCIVFSQHGHRDLPSMLSGGDLDGDLFSVIFNAKLWPRQIHEPADYPRADPLDIQRPVETNDIIEFFVKFMETDQLGFISNSHLILADQKPEGTKDKDCLKLAEMASIAVDYSKTGIPVNMADFPRSKNWKYRPDFMADAPHLVVNLEESFGGIQEEHFLGLSEDVQGRGRQYYKSHKALGQLYRAIDESKFMEEVHQIDLAYNRLAGHQESVMQAVWSFVQKKSLLIEWIHHKITALEIKQAYEEGIRDTAYQFSNKPRKPLTEKEVFTGNILGRDGAMLDRRVRERSTDMKEQVDRQIRYIIDWITYGDAMAQDSEDGDLEGSQYHPGASEEALPRSIACLHVALSEEGLRDRDTKLQEIKSFKYISAVICLKKLREYFGEAFGKRKQTPRLASKRTGL